jgi:putative endonuclease
MRTTRSLAEKRIFAKSLPPARRRFRGRAAAGAAVGAAASRRPETRPIPPFTRPARLAILHVMSASHEFGRLAEQLAAESMEKHGWTILERNFRCGHKEIDIIARRGDQVAFIEVKARTSRSFGHPLDAITAHKRREITAVARAWIARHGCSAYSYRFDAVWIIGSPGGRIELDHIPGAWRI